jgi:hypothetical protein
LPTVGVGQPDKIESLADIGRPEARRAQIERCPGVSRRFHVSRYKVEPSFPVRRCNLLAKDDWRAELSDEMERGGPKVPLISKPASRACLAERLARTGHGENPAFVIPSRGAEGCAPDADAGEQVDLAKRS